MKKYFYLSAAALATLFATSCSSDDVPAPIDGDLTTFQVQLPDQLVTRFGEGQKATKLYVAVYDQGTKTVRFSNFPGEGNTLNAESLDISEFSKGDKPTCTVSVPLVKGKQYDLIFFAQDPSITTDVYSFSTADQTMSVDYDGMANFQEGRDAFFGQITRFTSEGKGGSVTLTRPFAQVNIGTLDYDKYKLAAGVDSQIFGMKVSGIANTINLLDGKVEPADAANSATTTLLAPTPDNTYLVVNTKQYDYLAMGYFLVGSTATTQATLNVDLYVGNTTQSFASYPSVPAQMNFRTNIFGDLLTNSENFQVVIDADFNTNDINHEIKPVSSATELYSAISTAKDGDVIQPTQNLNLSTSGILSVDKNISINIPEGVTLTTARQENTANIVVAAGKTLTLTGNGTMSGDNRLVDVNGNLVVNGPTFTATTDNKGSIFSVNPGAKMTIESANLKTSYIAIWNDGETVINAGTVDARAMTIRSEGKTTINGGTFINRSKNSDPDGWYYGIKTIGSDSEIIINGGTFTGVQGIVSTDGGGKVTINDGVFSTHNTEGKQDAFYCVYATENGVVTINGGYFYGANDRCGGKADGTSCIVSGDNDVNAPSGTLVINGGYMSGKAYTVIGNVVTLVNLPQGYKYEPCNEVKDGMTFTWKVVKE